VGQRLNGWRGAAARSQHHHRDASRKKTGEFTFSRLHPLARKGPVRPATPKALPRLPPAVGATRSSVPGRRPGLCGWLTTAHCCYPATRRLRFPPGNSFAAGCLSSAHDGRHPRSESQAASASSQPFAGQKSIIWPAFSAPGSAPAEAQSSGQRPHRKSGGNSHRCPIGAELLDQARAALSSSQQFLEGATVLDWSAPLFRTPIGSRTE